MWTVERTQLRLAVEEFLFAEATMLDEERFDDWLALFTAGGHYWIPASRVDIDPSREVSLIYDDVAFLSERVWRFGSGLAFAQEPRSRTSHLVSNVEIEGIEGDAGPGRVVCAQAKFVVTEYRRASQRAYAGRYAYRLRDEGDGFGIDLKKVELVDADGHLGNVSLFL